MRDNLRLAAEDGNAIVTAILVSLLVLTVGISALATVDIQQGQARKQRGAESTFQLTESVLSAQIFQLSRRWPTQGVAYPAACNQLSTAVNDCPAASTVAAGNTGADFTGASWTTRVRDNSGGAESYYDPAVVEAQPAWDRNADDRLWVRAEGLLPDTADATRFKRRVLVGLIKVESKELALPRAAIVANHVATGHRGAKTMVDTNGLNQEWPTGDVLLRCEAKDSTTCVDVDNTKRRKQIDPPRINLNPTPAPTVLNAEALDDLRARATAQGNYHATCPASLAGDVPGEVVFIEDTGTGCSPKGTWNTPERPGVVVMGKGAGLRLGGTSVFYGLIYHANLSASTGFLVSLEGNATVVGSVQVAGAGGVYLQGSGLLAYNPNFLSQVKVHGTASLVQDSFRELTSAG